jgi:hypothetical protein
MAPANKDSDHFQESTALDWPWEYQRDSHFVQDFGHAASHVGCNIPFDWCEAVPLTQYNNASCGLTSNDVVNDVWDQAGTSASGWNSQTLVCVHSL